MSDFLFKDTDELKVEYVELYNEYMTCTPGCKEFRFLSSRLRDLEEILTTRFLFESGYTVEEKGDFNIFVKK